jgi:hypothetical protein
MPSKSKKSPSKKNIKTIQVKEKESDSSDDEVNVRVLEARAMKAVSLAFRNGSKQAAAMMGALRKN